MSGLLAWQIINKEFNNWSVQLTNQLNQLILHSDNVLPRYAFKYTPIELDELGIVRIYFKHCMSSLQVETG